MYKSYCFAATFTGLLLGGAALHAQTYQNYDQVEPRRSTSQSQYNQNTGYYQQRAGQQGWDTGNQAAPQSRRNLGQSRLPFGQQFEQRNDQSQFDPQYTEGGQEQQQDRQAGLGISLSNQAEQGVIVTRVHRDSPAERAGLEPGDHILMVDEREIQSPEQLISLIQQRRPGDTVRIELQRDNQTQTLAARLESRREALARQGWRVQPEQAAGARRVQFQQRMSERGDARQQQQMAMQLERMQQTVQQLSHEIDSLQNQLQQQQRESAYRGADEQQPSRLRERLQQAQQQREELQRTQQEQRERLQQDRND